MRRIAPAARRAQSGRERTADGTRDSTSLQCELLEAARRVARVAAGRSLALEGDDGALPPGASRAAVQDLCYGTLRRYGRGPAIVAALSRGSRTSPLIEALLWCSLYALDCGRYAEYTVVDQAVNACALARNAAAKGYVNALLRAYLRERKHIESRVLADAEAHYQHPRWWIDALQRAYPTDWERVLEAGNSHPPMCLRVNTRRIASEAYVQKLVAEGITWRSVGHGALLLERPVPVDRLPGFRAGEVSVQDAGAQRAAHLLELADGLRVLDACAAPGGKSAHILETARVELTAIDADAQRNAGLAGTLERLGHRASIVCADCAQPQSWWDGRPYDRILADVPCSASGVARRHPDMKWLRRAEDVRAFARRQGQMLDALWHVLAAGGRLLYVTCSVFPEENEDVVSSFCARTPGAERRALPDGGPAQMLPGVQHDGFYFALLGKRP